MSTETSTRPYQVGDRVRITDNLRHDLHPEAQYVYEGVVERIDPAADPDSEHKYGPYLWADTEPYTSPSSGEVFDRVFCPLTDDLTTGSDDDRFGRTIELLEPAPTTSPVFELADAARRITEAEELSTTATQDHGPLAAVLSDRTLAKVLSRPAYVPRETPSLVELDRREAAARVLNAAMDWAEAWGDTPVDASYMSGQEIALLNTARDYRAAVQS